MMRMLFLLFFLPLTLTAQTYFFDDFENGLTNWELSGLDWDTTSADHRSAAYSLTDSPDGDFLPNTNAVAKIAVPIDLSTSTNAELTFWQKLNMGVDVSGTRDSAYVELSTDNGNSWQILKSWQRVNYTSWILEKLDLSGFQSSVLIRFRLLADGDNGLGDGWYLDDVQIAEKDQMMLSFPFIDDFEGDLQNWLYGPEWEIITNDFRSPAQSVTESRTGDFQPNTNSMFILAHQIDLSSTLSPLLSFWHKLDIPTDGSGLTRDSVYVELSVDGGFSWAILQSWTRTTYTSWVHEKIDLSNYKLPIHIRFRLLSDLDGGVGDGWYLDDIQISEKDQMAFSLPFFDDFETGLENWFYSPEWQLTEANSFSPTHSLTESKSGNFMPHANSALFLAHPIDLTGSSMPFLKFAHLLDIPSDGQADIRDSAYVEVSTDGGAKWNIIKAYTELSLPNWEQDSVSLVPFISSPEVLARFRLKADYDGGVGDGWNLDNIEVKDLINNPPVINEFSASPSSGIAPLTVNFNCNAFDPDDIISEYRWDLDGDGTVDDTTASGSYNHTYLAPGSYTAKCTVADSAGAVATESVSIEVADNTARLVSIADASAAPGNTFQLYVSISDADAIAGIEAKITFDSNLLSSTAVAATPLTSNFLVADSIVPGRVSVSMASANGLPSGPGDILQLTFQVDAAALAGDTTTVRLETVALYSETLDSIPATIDNGLFTVSGTPVSVDTVAVFISPMQDTLEISDNQLFALWGIEDDGDTVNVSGDWVFQPLFGQPGSLDAATGHSSTFSASVAGDGQIIASLPSLSLADTAAVLVVSAERGDVHLDGAVKVTDAILTLQIVADLVIPALYQQWAADFDSSGDINTGDALAILNESLGGLSKTNLLTGEGTAYLRLGSPILQAEGVYEISVWAENRGDIAGMQFDVDYDREKFEISDINVTTGALLVKNLERAAQKARVAAIRRNGLLGEGNRILTFRLIAKATAAAAPEISLESIRLFDPAGKTIEFQWAENEGVLAGHPLAIPEIFSLAPNYPNPFNPETTIAFGMPEAGFATLNIYDIHGRLIRKLLNRRMSPGTYQLSWDGKNGQNQAAASGIYFYQLIVDNGKWQRTRKMILMK